MNALVKKVGGWTRRCRIAPRCFLSTDAMPYIDEWFRTTRKSNEFYATQSEPGLSQTRCYFYSIDLQGRLFLEETLPKNIATSIKDPKFLDFFFRRLRVVDDAMEELMKERQIPVQDYPYVSPCGKELNFIRPAATPVVFHTLTHGSPGELVYAATLTQTFSWSKIVVSTSTGGLYHQMETNKMGKNPFFGLIRSQVAVSLADRMEVYEEDGDAYFGIRMDLSSDILSPLRTLPKSAEPGPGALPFFDEAKLKP